MPELLTSDDGFRLEPEPAKHFRERVRISPEDARRKGVTQRATWGVLGIEPLIPVPGRDEHAVRVEIDDAVPPGVLRANEHFLERTGLGLKDEDRLWSIRAAANVTVLGEVVLEAAVEQDNVRRNLQALQAEFTEALAARCILVPAGASATGRALPMVGEGHYNLRSLRPEVPPAEGSQVVVIGADTRVQMFVPHRRGGVDMVLLVDASNSMTARDYEGPDGRPRARIDGVRQALDLLVEHRLRAGSRVSQVAVVLFASDTAPLFPAAAHAMAEVGTETELRGLRDAIKKLQAAGMSRLGVDVGGTNISIGLRVATETLDLCAREGNEKLIVLLSDGGHWERKAVSEADIISTSGDPAVLADTLHADSDVRIHTVAISSEDAVRRHTPEYVGVKGMVPELPRLREIATQGHGLFFESPDGRVLTRLFEDLGQGAIYPVNSLA